MAETTATLTAPVTFERPAERRRPGLRRFARNRAAVAGGVLLGLLVLVAIFADPIGGVDPAAIDWGKLGADTPKFIVESDATIVAPRIFACVLRSKCPSFGLRRIG